MISLVLLALSSSPTTAAVSPIQEAYVAHQNNPSKETYARLQTAYSAAKDKPGGIKPSIAGSVSYVLERDGQALLELRKALREGALGVQGRKEAERRISEVRERSGFVRLRLIGSGAMTIRDTREDAWPPVINTYGPHSADSVTLRLREGEHTVDVRSEESRCSFHFELEAGAEIERTCEPDRKVARLVLANAAAPGVDESRNTWLTPSLLAVGATTLGASLAAYVKSRRVTEEAERDYATRCVIDSPRPECYEPGSTPLFAQAGDWKTTSAVAGAIGGAALAAGAVLYFWSSDEDKEVNAWVSPTGVGVSAAF